MGYPHKSSARETPILSKHFGDPDAISLSGWRQRGGYRALEQALSMAPTDITNIVKESGLRGRGGAGFPTGLKWSFMKPGDGKPHYLCCNADESEPGTFKDRELMRWTPHALVEGCAIAAHAIGAETTYIYIRGEFTEPDPTMAPVMVWVVETGIPDAVAKKSVIAPADSALKPPTGFKGTIFDPIVLTIFHPPIKIFLRDLVWPTQHGTLRRQQLHRYRLIYHLLRVPHRGRIWAVIELPQVVLHNYHSAILRVLEQLAIRRR